MSTAIIIIQGLLALMFLMAGTIKLTQPLEKLLKILPWTKNFSLSTIRFVGLSELLGAIGIIVPQLTSILPMLSATAAIGLAVIMLLAASYHLGKKEFKEIGFNAILFILCVIVAVYRIKK